jgi:hypothetical protein
MRKYYSPGFTGKKHSEYSKMMMSLGHKIAHEQGRYAKKNTKESQADKK